jgi:hypothetical protein
MHNLAADVPIMIKLVGDTKQLLKEFRSDKSFEELIKSAEEIAQKLVT